MEGKVVEPEEIDEDDGDFEEEEEEKSSKTKQPKVGDILNYTKEADLGVVTEEGRVSVTENKDLAIQMILSGVVEMKQMLLQMLSKKKQK